LLLASLVLLQGAALPALGQVSQTLLTDPHQAAGPYGHGSKLTAHDSVVIEAPAQPPLAGTICYSINNNTGDSFFVPWNTPTEWSSFLQAIGAPYQLAVEFGTTPVPADQRWINNVTINACCPEQKVGKICDGLNGPIISNDELGYRYKGTLTGDIPNWAAQSDVYGPVFASAVSGDPNINYRVTFVCAGGTWVKTYEEGSCVPANGQCATGTSSMVSLPTDLSTLCAPGSTFGGFTNPGGPGSSGPWSWMCVGMPGMGNASCAPQPINGLCGAANGQTFTTAPALPADLCAAGSVSNFYLNLYDDPADWKWTWVCVGLEGGTPSATCNAPDGNPPAACGSAERQSVTTAPTGEQLCSSGTPENVI